METTSRKKALAEGLARYFTGKPCKHGHVAQRYTRNRGCVRCRNESARRWVAQNPEKRCASRRKSYAKNPAKTKATNARWNAKHRARNPGFSSIAMRRWRKANPEKFRALHFVYDNNRRTRMRSNGAQCSAADIAFLRAKQKGRCAACGKRHPTLEVDHIQAVARGGSGERPNLQLLCRPCNRSKSDKDAILWAQENGRLL